MTKISVLLCTYNGENLVPQCLNSILKQDMRNFEILCIDGGSKDGTREIIKGYQKKDRRVKLVINRNKLPEGLGNGKWLGFRKSLGEVICIIDQDNVLQDEKLFTKAVYTLKKKSSALGVLGGLKHDISDAPIVRYISLTGTDSFMAYRSIDFIRNIVSGNKKEEILRLQTDNMSLTGGNCFFYRKSDLKGIGGYDQDVFVVKRLILAGKDKLSIIDNATKHYAEQNFYKLVKKKFSWGESYFNKKIPKFNYLPGTANEFKSFSKNVVFNLLFFPNFYYSFKLFRKSKDFVSFMFPYIALVNTIAYAINFFKKI